MSKKISLVSLGCPKNQIDGERMLGALKKSGFEILENVDSSDVVIVNTCGFIESAKQEAIDTILDMAELKKEGTVGKILVTGCLAERYKEQLRKEIPEIDGVIGIGANDDIVSAVEKLCQNSIYECYPDKEKLSFNGERELLNPPYYAYLKIAEGCSNHCTYCAIPSIRGEFRSREFEDIIDEAKSLADKGVKELIVVAQDTTRYGEDLYGRQRLPELLTELSKIDGIRWIRILYCYPDRLSDELLETMAENEKVLNYIDLPLQHADETVLKRMNRYGNREKLLSLIKHIREKVPDVVLRTTLIVGFPGETEEAFETLSEFVNEARFDRLGCFTYSAEEDTPAASFPDQIDEQVKLDRCEIIMEQQNRIMDEINDSHTGKTVECVVEGYDDYADVYYGRSVMDAPEIDGIVSFTCGFELKTGEFVQVEIMGANEYGLIGEVV
ncbi:MAG: 30S ribosomal protein S12 methylthiotransferase RimO [Clostridiales bacterium]|nr:30S ribosomal protein S12 methylthiotransferase RimO [Clostridiales bacterium]